MVLIPRCMRKSSLVPIELSHPIQQMMQELSSWSRSILNDHFHGNLHNMKQHYDSILNSHFTDDPFFPLYQKSNVSSLAKTNVVQDQQGFRLKLDMLQFSPHEVTVKVINNSVVVEGCQNEKKEGHSYVTRHFKRIYQLPSGVDSSSVKSDFSVDNVLTITAKKSDTQLQPSLAEKETLLEKSDLLHDHSKVSQQKKEFVIPVHLEETNDFCKTNIKVPPKENKPKETEKVIPISVLYKKPLKKTYLPWISRKSHTEILQQSSFQKDTKQTFATEKPKESIIPVQIQTNQQSKSVAKDDEGSRKERIVPVQRLDETTTEHSSFSAQDKATIIPESTKVTTSLTHPTTTQSFTEAEVHHSTQTTKQDKSQTQASHSNHSHQSNVVATESKSNERIIPFSVESGGTEKDAESKKTSSLKTEKPMPSMTFSPIASSISTKDGFTSDPVFDMLRQTSHRYQTLLDRVFKNDLRNLMEKISKIWEKNKLSPAGSLEFLTDSTAFSNSSIKEEPDSYEVKIDVGVFNPEEITLKVDGDNVAVEAKHEEEEDEKGFISRQFCRKYQLPTHIDNSNIHSELTSDGVLIVKAPKVSSEKTGNERIIPISLVDDDQSGVMIREMSVCSSTAPSEMDAVVEMPQ